MVRTMNSYVNDIKCQVQTESNGREVLKMLTLVLLPAKNLLRFVSRIEAFSCILIGQQVIIFFFFRHFHWGDHDCKRSNTNFTNVQQQQQKQLSTKKRISFDFTAALLFTNIHNVVYISKMC